MKNYFPKNILIEQDLILKAETPGGILRRLPSLFEALQFSQDTRPYILQLEQKLDAKNRILEKEKKQALKWLEHCFRKLENSPFAEHRFVKPTLNRAKSLIIDRYFNPQEGIPMGKSFIEISVAALADAANVIATFGPAQLFEGWAIIDSTLFSPIRYIDKKFSTKLSKRWKIQKTFDEKRVVTPVFPKNEKGEIPFSKGERKQVERLFGRGFQCWFVEHHKGCAQSVSLRQGFLKELLFPPCLSSLFHEKTKKGNRDWKERVESDPVTLYSYLKMLAQYKIYAPSICPSHNIETWEDFEKFDKQLHTGYFLSCFSSERAANHPHSTQQLQTMINRFLEMLEGKMASQVLIKGGVRKSELAKEAAEWCEKELYTKVKSLSSEERKSFTKEKACEYLKKCAAEEGKADDFVKKTPIYETIAPTVRRKLQEEGILWKPLGGRPLAKK